ncbi:MAG: hypothetical protein JWN38_162 [Candidatus Saccharibacteria bacterium]|nr:hypothetical protein [Candidatus Saccharibacteria bacterium]
MQETLLWAEESPHALGVAFYGATYEDTADPKRFKVVCYAGNVVGVVSEPPSFRLSVEEAAVQIGECDCPTVSASDIFENLEQTMAEAELSAELDEFAGVETKDPHYENLPLLVGTEIILRFDRLGANIVSGKTHGWLA